LPAKTVALDPTDFWKDMPYYYAILPQTCELIGAVASNIAITMTATSVY